MDLPTIDDVRQAKTEIVELFKDREHFVGAGIGESDGQFVVRVNWRLLPPGIVLPDHVGRVKIEHHEVGSVRAQ
jgi:hypothetical protein